MNLKNLILTLLVVLTAAAGSACKKKSGQGVDNSSYLSDQSNATTPSSNSGTSTTNCLGKGAMGVQALLTKDSVDCTVVTPAKCGNGTTEAGEQCDDGAKNGTPGDLCDANCKTVSGGSNNNNSGGSVTIKTTTLSTAYQGEAYSVYVSAICKPGPCSFSLKPGTSLPKNFSMSATGNIISTGVTVDVGSYPVSIVVQNNDDSKSAAHDYTLTVQKHLKIRSFVEGYMGFEVVDRTKDTVLNEDDFDSKADYSDPQSFIPITESGTLMVWPSHYSDISGCVGDLNKDKPADACRPDFGWIVVGVNFVDPIDKDLSPDSEADDAADYTWSVKVNDGKDLSDIVVDKAYSSKMGKQVGYMLYIKPDTKDFANYYKDFDFKNVKITVSDGKGDSGQLTIGDLHFVAPAKTAEADPCNKLAITVTNMNIDGGDVKPNKDTNLYDINLDQTAIVKFTVSGGVKPDAPIVTSDLATTATTGYPPDSEYLWQKTQDGDDGSGHYIYKRTFRYGTMALTDSLITSDMNWGDPLTIKVTDPACSKKPIYQEEFNVNYPEIDKTPPNPMRIRFGIGANDTEDDRLTMTIKNDDGNILYDSFAVDGQSYLSLDGVGDSGPDCNDENDCNIAESATLDLVTGATTSSGMPSLKAHAKLYFHVDTIKADSWGELDVRFHSITVYGKYWYATFSDTGGTYGNITSDEKSDSEKDGTYDGSLGALTWHHICVPNYDDDSSVIPTFSCPK